MPLYRGRKEREGLERGGKGGKEGAWPTKGRQGVRERNKDKTEIQR